MLTCKHFAKFFELWGMLINEEEQVPVHLSGMRNECRVNGEQENN